MCLLMTSSPSPSTQVLYRAQKERDETFYVGTRFDKVRRLEDDNWRLLERDIVLDQAVITSHNLSVLF